MTPTKKQKDNHVRKSEVLNFLIQSAGNKSKAGHSPEIIELQDELQQVLDVRLTKRPDSATALDGASLQRELEYWCGVMTSESLPVAEALQLFLSQASKNLYLFLIWSYFQEHHVGQKKHPELCTPEELAIKYSSKTPKCRDWNQAMLGCDF